MFETMLSGTTMWVAERVIILVIVLVALSYAWPYVKNIVTLLLSKVVSVEKTESVVSAVSNAVIVFDEYQARLALVTAAGLFEKHGNLQVASALRSYVVEAVKWSDASKSGE